MKLITILKQFKIKPDNGKADEAMINAFIDFLKHPKPDNRSGLAARNSVAIGDMATSSLRNGSIPKAIEPFKFGC